MCAAALIGLAVHATGPASAVQGATFRSRDHHLVCSSVSSICAEFAESRGDHGRAECAMWITLRFGAGSSIMRRNSVGVVDANCGTRTDRGGWMKPTFALLASGPIYIGRWTRQATRLISCSLRSVMPLLPNASSRKPYGHQTILINESINVDGNPAYPRVNRGTQGNARTRPALPLSTYSLSQQYR